MTPKFFSPLSIAVIGASENPQKLGYTVVKNLKDSGYKGRIYPVNNKATIDTNILSLKVYPSVSDIHEIPELVIISIPSGLVFEELLKSYAIGTRNFVIITAGFKEIGNDRDEALINNFIASHPDANILGPNCLGFIDTKTPVNASFAASFPKDGDISFFSQSGALCTAILDWSEKLGLGFNKFVSIGNKNNISENTFLSDDYLGNKPAFFYLESFVNGKTFMKKAISIKSPIVVLHPGRYTETSSAMQSHTGSLASDDRIVEAAMSEAGAIRAYGLEDIMDLMMIYHFYPEFREINKVAIVSNAGGPGIITTDSIKDYGLELAKLSDNTQKLLSERLPRTANIHNPVDVVGDAMADRYGYALDVVLGDPNVDAVIVLLTPQAMTQIDLTAEYISRLSKSHNKVVIASFMGGKRVDRYEQFLFLNGVPYFDYPERAVWALSKLKTPMKSIKKIDDVKITETEPLDLIKNIFSTPQEQFIINIGEVDNFLSGQNIAMKLISDQMWHKTDSGGVKLHLDTPEKRKDALNQLQELGDKQKIENSQFEYKIIVQEMVKMDLELFIGAKRDANFGNAVVFGIGGIYANIIDESLIFLEYASKEYIVEKLNKSKIGQILKGARGQKGINLDEVAEAILKLHQLMNNFNDVSEIDINPLGLVDGKLFAIDVKIKNT